jgi:hypothetical protein
VDCEFGRRQAEDEPSITRVDVLEGKIVPENVAQRFGFRAA